MGIAVSASEAAGLRVLRELAPKYDCRLREKDAGTLCQWARRRGPLKDLTDVFLQPTWKDIGADLRSSVQEGQPEASKLAPIYRTLTKILTELHGEVEAKKALQRALGSSAPEEASFVSPTAPADPADAPLPMNEDELDMTYPDLTKWNDREFFHDKQRAKKEVLERKCTWKQAERWLAAQYGERGKWSPWEERELGTPLSPEEEESIRTQEMWEEWDEKREAGRRKGAQKSPEGGGRFRGMRRLTEIPFPPGSQPRQRETKRLITGSDSEQ